MTAHWSVRLGHLLSSLLLLISGGLSLHPQGSHPYEGDTACPQHLEIRGLYEPRVISGTLQVRALPGSPTSTVIFYIDDKEVGRGSNPPFNLIVPAGAKNGLPPGPHVLHISAISVQGLELDSGPIQFSVVPDLNEQFSAQLSAYASHPSALDEDIRLLIRSTTSENAALASEETQTRRLVFGMYLNVGIDPSLDSGNDQSEVLTARLPSHAAAQVRRDWTTPSSLWLSPDAVFYHAIPKEWPRVPLPKGYISQIQFSTARNGDGIGFGEVIAKSSDPLIQVVSQWYDVKSTRRIFRFRMPSDWSIHLPTQEEGDRHLIFIDPSSNSFISSYKTSLNHETGGPKGLYVSSPHSLDGLGDSGGSIAAGFAELPLLIQPGEATDPEKEIPHAIGGAVGRTWAARVYPATSRDEGMLNSVNPCTHRGYSNTGVVPYGGIVQLDPDLDLDHLALSLPARRILRAMQQYGYYVMDFGCGDLDIYTAIDSEELDSYGGTWGNDHGPGVQTEIQNVLARSKLYVVPPPMKR